MKAFYVLASWYVICFGALACGDILYTLSH